MNSNEIMVQARTILHEPRGRKESKQKGLNTLISSLSDETYYECKKVLGSYILEFGDKLGIDFSKLDDDEIITFMNLSRHPKLEAISTQVRRIANAIFQVNSSSRSKLNGEVSPKDLITAFSSILNDEAKLKFLLSMGKPQFVLIPEGLTLEMLQSGLSIIGGANGIDLADPRIRARYCEDYDLSKANKARDIIIVDTAKSFKDLDRQAPFNEALLTSLAFAMSVVTVSGNSLGSSSSLLLADDSTKEKKGYYKVGIERFGYRDRKKRYKFVNFVGEEDVVVRRVIKGKFAA